MEKKVLIIGAGASGIAAATKLLSNGFQNIIILEAEDRIGGRINTVPFGKNVVDMGAQWCHGQQGNVVYELAKDKNLIEMGHEESLTFKFIQSNGEKLPQNVADKLMEIGMSILEGDKYENEKAEYKGSIGNFFSDKYYQLFENNDIDPEVRRQMFDFFHNITNSLEASDSWYDVSSKPHGYEDTEGDHMINWKDKGYVTVFDLLQNKIGQSPDKVINVSPHIHFKKQVKKITYNKPTSDQHNIVQVDCSDGSTFHADHVICTISLAVLKEQHLNLFDPLLSQSKYDSIEGMFMGTVDKIYLEFENPFWIDDNSIIGLLWRLEQIKEVRNDPVNGNWLDGLISFNSVKYQPNILCSWITGSKARAMERASDADVKAGVEKVLRMFMKDADIPDAKAMIRSKWYSNPNFRGSYTHYTLKGDALGASCEKLAEPIYNSNGRLVLQFAGEATGSTHLGNVHSAVETGWREADRLINLYKEVVE